MKLQVEPLDTHEVRLTITVDDEVVSKARRDAARELSRRVRIPGFRPGHAPIAVLIRAVGGEDVFEAEVTDRVAQEVYAKALDAADIKPYGPGQIEEVKREPYQLVARVPLEPSVDLKDYRSIRLPVPSVTVGEDEIEDQLQRLREEHAMIELAERPAAMGDLVELQVVGKLPGSDEEVLRIRPRRGMVLSPDQELVPGLSALVVGMSAGEHKEASLTLPDDDRFEEALRGQTVDLAIDVERVNSRTLPEVSDELAQTVGSFTTLAELREDLRKRLLEYKQRMVDREYASQALEAFTALAEVKYPPAFIEDRLDDVLKDFKDDVRELEGLPFEEWLKVQGKTEQQMREELRPLAEQRGKRGLVMRELARAEKLQVGEDEIAAEVELVAMQYGNSRPEVRRVLAQATVRSTIKNNILSNKVINQMVRIARGEADAAPEGAPVSASEQEAVAT